MNSGSSVNHRKINKVTDQMIFPLQYREHRENHAASTARNSPHDDVDKLNEPMRKRLIFQRRSLAKACDWLEFVGKGA